MNEADPVVFHLIGTIHTPHRDPEQTPIQPVYARGVEGFAQLAPEYAEGLQDLAGFSHIYLIYLFHRAQACRLTVQPYLEDVTHGIFATRAPQRPNPIGFSVVRLSRIEGHTLYLRDVDMLDGTPLLDIKPYIPRFDHREDVQSGWQAGVDESTAQARGHRLHARNDDRTEMG